jgi:hypothetical protein
MANWGNAAMGAAGGFLTGGPIGAGLGFVGGLFGGDDQQMQTSYTRYKYESLDGERQDMLDQIMKRLPGLMSQLTPQGREKLVANLEAKFGDKFTAPIKDAFMKQRGQAEAALSRTGGALGSIGASQRGEIAKQEGMAVGEAQAQASLMAENLGSSIWGQYAATAGNMMNTGINIFNSRKVTSTYSEGTSTVPGSAFNSIIGMGMGALEQGSGSYYDTGSFFGTKQPYRDPYLELLQQAMNGNKQAPAEKTAGTQPASKKTGPPPGYYQYD